MNDSQLDYLIDICKRILESVYIDDADYMPTVKSDYLFEELRQIINEIEQEGE
ncbi:hypothetical protein J7J62_08170 [bacterium]|nr:hypothetical protein [bacterium]